ncbi:MAG: site-2 protease family protein [Candidatus Marinimicrobia bacterium]|jgi:Zn-dependent protease|nr:site-2 protease family protein [Candidatus Neomarinimicrobiota bacterium]
MLIRLPIEVLIILLPILVFSLCFHEFSHGYIAYKLGDPTAERNGRLTLNPLAHLDPVGSLMILFVGFGWAKPVPVNPVNFRNPRVDMMKVAFAGPASNLLLAFIGGTLMRFLNYTQVFPGESLLKAIYFFIFINIALAVFNMIPIAPLDGSQIFGNYISKTNPELAWKMQMYGPKILMVIILIGILTPFSLLGTVMMPFIKIFMFLFAGL